MSRPAAQARTPHFLALAPPSGQSETGTVLVIDELDRWTIPQTTAVPGLCFCYCRVEQPSAARVTLR
jgi:hypothetical protein